MSRVFEFNGSIESEQETRVTATRFLCRVLSKGIFPGTIAMLALNVLCDKACTFPSGNVIMYLLLM